MDTPLPTSSDSPPETDLPDRQCSWCQVTMMKRLVAEGRFIHYTCPSCLFQHTGKYSGA